jgi:hypothetical protein
MGGQPKGVRLTLWTDEADPPECGQTVQKCGQRVFVVHTVYRLARVVKQEERVTMSESENREKLVAVAMELYRNHAIQQQNVSGTAFYVKATENMAAMGKLVTALGGKLIKVDQGSLTERFVVTDDAGMVIPNNVRLA